jgi:amino-acid N-acetyltransferase
MSGRALVALPAGDLGELRSALADAGLPHDDLDEPGRRFYRLADGGRTLGWAGLEIAGGEALLRSVVVPDRGRGTGRELVARVVEAARVEGVERLWLLTTTAAGFFTKLGFDTLRREAAPAAIRASREFASICPASATCMTLKLKDELQ